MSVRNPSRPWLMPISGTSNGASCLATASIVPSPPMTIRVGGIAQRRAGRSRQPGIGAERAVSASIVTGVTAGPTKAASRDSGAAMPGLS